MYLFHEDFKTTARLDTHPVIDVRIRLLGKNAADLVAPNVCLNIQAQPLQCIFRVLSRVAPFCDTYVKYFGPQDVVQDDLLGTLPPAVSRPLQRRCYTSVERADPGVSKQRRDTVHPNKFGRLRLNAYFLLVATCGDSKGA